MGRRSKRSSWSATEFGGEVMTGRLGYRLDSSSEERATIPIYLGILAKAGYQYSLGDGVYGVWRFGFGPVLAGYEASMANNTDEEAKDMILGLAAQLGFGVELPMSEKLDITAGIKWTHYAMDVGDVEVNTNGAKTTETGKAINMNVPEVYFGIRFF